MDNNDNRASELDLSRLKGQILGLTVLMSYVCDALLTMAVYEKIKW